MTAEQRTNMRGVLNGYGIKTTGLSDADLAAELRKVGYTLSKPVETPERFNETWYVTAEGYYLCWCPVLGVLIKSDRPGSIESHLYYSRHTELKPIGISAKDLKLGF